MVLGVRHPSAGATLPVEPPDLHVVFAVEKSLRFGWMEGKGRKGGAAPEAGCSALDRK